MASSVLLIDDDAVLLDMMSGAFRTAGYSVRTARNGREGLQALDNWAPDLVVTDIVMPEIEGIGVLLAVKRRADAPKVITISGAGRLRTGDYLGWARQLGADGVLPKPFRMSELVRLAGQLLQDQSSNAKTIGV